MHVDTLKFYKYSPVKKPKYKGKFCRIPFDTFWAAYNYWISVTSENLSANLIQAQRDYFGAHTYQRKDDSTLSFYHTNWLEK